MSIRLPVRSSAIRVHPRPVNGARVMRPEDVEVWAGPKYQLLAKIKLGVARGEVAETGRWAPARGTPGWFVVEVRRLKQPRPRWRIMLLRGCAVLVMVSAPATLIWHLVTHDPFVALAILLCGTFAIAVKVKGWRKVFHA